MILRHALISLFSCLTIFVSGCGSAENQATSGLQKSSAIKNAPWKKFSHKDGRFSLLMPGIPVETVSINDTVVGPLEDHSFLLKAVQGKYKAAYLISYVDYPKEKRGILSSSEILESIFQSVQEENKDRMVYKKKIKFKNHEGIEYQYTGKIQAGHIVSGRNYLIDNRLLMLTAIMSKEQFARGDAAKYLDSLELTG